MTGINEARERLMEQFDLRLGLEPALARPDDIRALLDDHARLNELLGNSEQLAPATDLEQFRRLAHGWVVEAGGVAADVKHACADELLALIDGQANPNEPKFRDRSTHRVYRGSSGYLPCYCHADADHMIGDEQPTKGEGE